MSAFKPYIKSNHKYARLYRRHLNFDLDLLKGIYFSAKGDLDLAEAYYNSALRYCLRCLTRQHTKYKSSMYSILNGLSEILFKQGDYLAAEVQYDYAIRHMAPDVTLTLQ